MKLKKKYKKCKTLCEMKAKVVKELGLPTTFNSIDPPGVDCDNPRDEIERLLCEMMRG